MIDPEHALPISKQAEELEIARSTVYYRPRPVSDADLMLMRRIDELHLIEAFEEALRICDRPGIINTDQGSQFTSEAFTRRLKKEGIDISMDGKGRWADNVFVERLWRSLKYEHVYLHAYESVAEARTKIGRYFEFYNRQRPHSSLGAETPDQVYFHRPPEALAA
jgi:putative transposase